MVIGIDASRAFGDERTGTENYSYHLITHMLRLTAAKKHVFVLFIRPNAQLPKELDGYSNVIVKEISRRWLWTQIGLAWETWKRVEREGGADKLEVLWVPAHTLPVLRNSGIRMVVTIHGLEYKWLPEYNNWLQRWYLPLSTYYAARAATALIAVSEATKRDLLREVKINPDKVRVILEGVEAKPKSDKQLDQEVSEKIYAKYGLVKQKYILFVGTVQPRKNLRALIEAFAGFYRTHPDYKLVIAGKIGWRAERDLARVAELEIVESVVWTGRVDELVLRALYLGAIVYVQPSWTEGFGLPVLEAMQNGVAVIVSDGGALPEVVSDAGRVVPLKRQFTAELQRAIEHVVMESDYRKQLVAFGSKRARELSWDECAKATLETLTRR